MENLTVKQKVLNAFDVCISEIEKRNNSNNRTMHAIGFIVALRGKAVQNHQGVGFEVVIVDEVNMKRKRDYLATSLNEEGFYINSNNCVQAATVFAGPIEHIGMAAQKALGYHYALLFGESDAAKAIKNLCQNAVMYSVDNDGNVAKIDNIH